MEIIWIQHVSDLQILKEMLPVYAIIRTPSSPTCIERFRIPPGVPLCTFISEIKILLLFLRVPFFRVYYSWHLVVVLSPCCESCCLLDILWQFHFLVSQTPLWPNPKVILTNFSHLIELCRRNGYERSQPSRIC